MKYKILKQIEENVKLKLSVIISNEVMSGNEKQEAILQLFGSHNNIKENVDVEMSKNIEIVLPSATSACKYDVQVKSMVGEVLFEHTFYGNSKPLIKQQKQE